MDGYNNSVSMMMRRVGFSFLRLFSPVFEDHHHHGDGDGNGDSSVDALAATVGSRMAIQDQRREGASADRSVRHDSSSCHHLSAMRLFAFVSFRFVSYLFSRLGNQN